MACNLGRRAMNDDDEHYVHATETFQGTLARSGSRQKKICGRTRSRSNFGSTSGAPILGLQGNQPCMRGE